MTINVRLKHRRCRSRLLKTLLHRLQVLCGGPRGAVPPVIPGFKVVWDTFVRRQTTIQTYRRVKVYRNDWTGTTVFIQYDPAAPWLAPFKLTFCTDARSGLLRDELEEFLGYFENYRLLTVELPFDFVPESGVNKGFVLRHAVFGKSRRRKTKHSGERLNYGTRKSTKFVRCYQKTDPDVFRVELQLQSEWLRQRRIRKLQDLIKLPRLIFPKHLRFVQIDWDSVSEALLYQGGRKRLGKLVEAKRQSASVHAGLRYLKNETGLVNPYRFLRTMEITGKVRRRFRRWIRRWCDVSDR